MKKITLSNVENWTQDNLKRCGSSEYFTTFYHSLAYYVSDMSDNTDDWEFLQSVLDQYSNSLVSMLHDTDPIVITSHSSGSVDTIEPVYSSIYFEGYNLSSVLDVLEKDYYNYGSLEIENVLYALDYILLQGDPKEFYNLDVLSIESDGLYIKFGTISERYFFSDIELEVLNRLADAGLDAHDTIIFKEGLKTLAIMVVNSLEYNAYIPKGFFNQ